MMEVHVHMSSDLQYERQVLFWNQENQEKLARSSVAIVGSHLTAQLIAFGLVGLGVMDITVMDNRRIGSTDRSPFYSSKWHAEKKVVDMLGPSIKTLNGQVAYHPEFFKYSGAFLSEHDPKYIIVTEQDPDVRMAVAWYCKKHQLPHFSVGVSEQRGELTVWNGKTTLDEKLQVLLSKDTYTEPCDDPLTSLVLAGYTLNEIRRHHFMITKSEKQPDAIYTLNYDPLTRFTNTEKRMYNSKRETSSLRALVVGAGAIGTYVAFSLGHLGFGHVDVMDHDWIDITNLNRQLLYYGNVNERKAKVLSEKITAFNPQVTSQYFVQRFDERTEQLVREKKYHFIFSCVDNIRTREDISRVSKRTGTVVSNGATSAYDGIVSIAIPSQTACLSCQHDFKEQLEQAKIAQNSSVSCAQADPSVVIPNMVIGANMVQEALLYLKNPRGYTLPGMHYFHSAKIPRLAVQPYERKNTPCACG